MMMEMYCGLLLFINSNRILLQLMLRISLTLQAALLSIFCRLSACSADLRGFQSPGTACLFSAAMTVSFPGQTSRITGDQEEAPKVYPFLKLRVKDGYWLFRTDSSCSSGSIAEEREDLDKEEEQELHRQDSLQVEGRIGALGKLFPLYQKEDGRGDQ
ncbi:hypothetical protein L1987_88870 [Smallanthus sonchifolius]|nr:hypothetical protein L1987_88870 [Smallanthus sonchifolius]